MISKRLVQPGEGLPVHAPSGCFTPGRLQKDLNELKMPSAASPFLPQRQFLLASRLFYDGSDNHQSQDRVFRFEIMGRR